MDIILIALVISSLSAVILLFLLIHTKRKFNFEQTLRDEFMAVMIHELRSPLSVIKSSSNLIVKEYKNISQQQIVSLLQQMETSAGDLLGIVNDLLDISKISAGKVELFKHEVNVVEIIRFEVDSFSRVAHEKGLGLHFKTNVDELIINCDPEKVKHILSNLISNSVKYTQEGEVSVVLEDSRDYITVSICDTGMGVSNDTKGKLFNKYMRAQEMAASKEKGTGLGLVIVKGMIEAHGGKIWIEDNEPKGAKFIFTIPKVAN